nr:XRE family transcriptional regulator [uncultured Rhodopila sp.]
MPDRRIVDEDTAITRETGNVFADLGYPDAEERHAKVGLAYVINGSIERQRLALAEAAERLAVDQPMVSPLAQNRLDEFSVGRFVSGLTIKEINREIDAGIINPGVESERLVSGPDLFYLAAMKDVRTRLDPALRKLVREAIADAASAGRNEAAVHRLAFRIDLIRRDILGPFEALERSKDDHIESRPNVLGGEPVIKGTRIAARHVADVMKRGATREELRDDLELTDAQIDAAVVFDRTCPKRGRPAAFRHRTVHVSAA